MFTVKKMLSKVLFFVCLSMLLQCVLLQSTEDKEKADEWIEQTLFEQKPIQHFVNASQNATTPSNKPDGRPGWTVVILKLERVENKTLYIQHCTGSLIGLGVVLTAASCMLDIDTVDYVVRAGDWTEPHDECRQRIQERSIHSVVINPKYQENSTSEIRDIALIFLKDPFRKNCVVNTVCLATMELPELQNVQCTITGWKHRTLELSGYKKFARLNATVVSRKNCRTVLRQTVLGEDFKLAAGSMCAVIKSDSIMLLANGGAPLVCQVEEPLKMYIQVGILSYGFESAALPSVLTSVKNYNKWIVTWCEKKGYQLHSC